MEGCTDLLPLISALSFTHGSFHALKKASTEPLAARAGEVHPCCQPWELGQNRLGATRPVIRTHAKAALGQPHRILRLVPMLATQSDQ